MPCNPTLKLALTVALLTASTTALALPFASFDSRSMAMGGAGVAVGGADAAPLFNPALLSVAKAEDDFAIVLPTIGVRVADPDNLRDGINSTDTALKNLDSSVTTFNSTLLASDATKVASNIRTVSSQLNNMSNKPITVEAGFATVAAIPSKTLGSAFYATGTITAGGVFQYKDATTLTNLANDADLCATNQVTYATNCTNVKNFNTSTLTSGVRALGVQLSEMGFALSREFQIKEHNVSFGVTPKIVKAKLFETTIKVNDTNNTNINSADNIAEYNTFNFDLGAAKNYDNGWRSGFVIKNVLPQNLDFKNNQVATGNTLSLKPQARIGVSHANSWSTVALDVDLTRNDPAGLENASQYVALGGELDAWGWAQLRAGYRVDMVNSSRNVASVGVGLAPFKVVHIDFAYAGNANEVGASFQLGVRF